MKYRGQLEDIEEELGIDLIILLNGFINGIYVIEENDNYIVEHSMTSIEKFIDGWEQLLIMKI